MVDPVVCAVVLVVVALGWYAWKNKWQSSAAAGVWNSSPSLAPRSRTRKQIPRGKLKSTVAASPQPRQRHSSNLVTAAWTPGPAGWSSPMSSTNIHSTSFMPSPALPKLPLSPVVQFSSPESKGGMGGKGSVPSRPADTGAYMSQAGNPARSMYGRRPLWVRPERPMPPVQSTQRSMSPPGVAYSAAATGTGRASPPVITTGQPQHKLEVEAKTQVSEEGLAGANMDIQESAQSFRKRKLEQRHDSEAKRKRSPPKGSPRPSSDVPCKPIAPQRRPVPMEIPRVAEKRPLELSDDEEDVQGDEKKGRVDDSGPPTPELPSPEIKSNLPLRKGRLLAKGSVEYMAKVPKSNFSYEEYMADRLAEEERVSDMLKAVGTGEKAEDEKNPDATGTTTPSAGTSTAVTSNTSVLSQSVPTAAVLPQLSGNSNEVKVTPSLQLAPGISGAAAKLNFDLEPKAASSPAKPLSLGVATPTGNSGAALSGTGISATQSPNLTLSPIVSPPKVNEEPKLSLSTAQSVPNLSSSTSTTPVSAALSINTGTTGNSSVQGKPSSGEFKPLFSFPQGSTSDTNLSSSVVTVSPTPGPTLQSAINSAPDHRKASTSITHPQTTNVHSGLSAFGNAASSGSPMTFGTNTSVLPTTSAGLGLSGTAGSQGGGPGSVTFSLSTEVGPTSNNSNSQTTVGLTGIVSSAGSGVAGVPSSTTQSGFAFGTGNVPTTSTSAGLQSGFGTGLVSQPTAFNNISQPTGFVTNPTVSHSGFGTNTTTQSSGFGKPSPQLSGFASSTSAPSPAFELHKMAPAPSFGMNKSAQGPAFGSSTNAPSPAFGSNTVAPLPAFGSNTNASSPAFGSSTNLPPPAFGSNTIAPSPAIGLSSVAPSPVFGARTTTVKSSFGTNMTSQSSGFGINSGVQRTGFGPSPPIPQSGFATTTNTQPSSFTANTSLTSAFSFGKSLSSTSTTTPQLSSFGANTASSQSFNFGAGASATTTTASTAASFPQFGNSTTSSAKTITSATTTGFNFGAASSGSQTPVKSLNFGSPTTPQKTGFPFGQATPSGNGTSVAAGQPTQNGFSFGTPKTSSGFSFGQNSSTPSGISFGTPKANTSTVTFGQNMTSPPGQGAFGINSGPRFGATTTPGVGTIPAPAFGSSSVGPSPNVSLNFGSPAAPSAPGAMFSMGSGNTAPRPRATVRAARRRGNKK